MTTEAYRTERGHGVVRRVIYRGLSMSASQGSCRVQRVVERGRESWTVVGTDRRPVQAADRYLAWLTSIEKSPNTVRAYACDLKLFFTFLTARDVGWDRVSLETLGEFTAWLRSPAENVIVLEHGTPARTASSVNRTLSAVFGFYEFHARDGVSVARELVARGRSGSGSYKPFLHGIAKSSPRGRIGRLGEVERLPRSLTVEQVQAILDAQRRLRDRFLFALLFETGMRVGQALGLRHEDVVSGETPRFRATQVPLRRRGKARRIAEAGRCAVIGIVASRWWSLRRPEAQACTLRVGLVSDFFQPPPSGTD